MAPVAQIRPRTAASIRRRLLAWWDANARELPWRARPGIAPDPYRVWLSEVMLQQTTVAHAAPYFRDFTARWPTVERLAAAPDGEVMAAWAGLGYYARARNLLACARVVAHTLAGAFPPDEAGLRRLPGVGAYSAAAIAAIAFQARANVVDANVERAMARLFALETPLPQAKAEIRALAGQLAAPARPGDWAQALMDLGATLCRPSSPLCADCPLSSACLARKGGQPQSYPRRAAKLARPQHYGVAFLIWRAGEIAMVRRPPRGLLGGMLGLPTTPWREAPWSAADIRRAAPVAASWRRIGAIAHGFTHFSLELEVWIAEEAEALAGAIWLAADQALNDAPTLFVKALRLSLGGDRSVGSSRRRRASAR